MSAPTDDVVREFLAEASEALVLLESALVELETTSWDDARVASLFRGVHSIKGTAGFFGFERIVALTHVGEGVLARLREGTLKPTTEVADALLAFGDAVRVQLDALYSTGVETETDHGSVISALEALTASSLKPAATIRRPGVGGGPKSTRLPSRSTAPSRRSPSLAPSRKPAVARTAEPMTATAETSIRLDVALVDRLLNLAGEMVLARNRIVNLHAASREHATQAVTQELSRVTTELHELVMKVRLQPIHSLWNRLPRLIRDVARECKKKVRLTMSGEDTELDRALLDAMRDPLTHILRNSVDHGIETPEQRLAAGKSEQGTVALSAYQQGGFVFIRVEDNGKGLHPDKLRARAVEKGLLSAEEAQALDDRQAIALVFRPGFSTASAVTRISGRGVGMDVVKNNVERVGGVVDISSTAGVGTVVSIKLPLTLAIVPALVVKASGTLFAIPQASIVEVVHVSAEVPMEEFAGAAILRLRGELLPLAVLSRIMQPEVDGELGRSVVVIGTEGRRFGIVVQGIVDTEEIVVKPLSHELRALPIFAGAAVLGSGEIVLVLDVGTVAQSARVGLVARSTSLRAAGPIEAESSNSWLLVSGTGEDRLALPLSSIHRVDRIERSRLERAGSRTLVQYHGGLLQVVSLAEYCGRAEPEQVENEPLPVLVLDSKAGSTAFAVARILDVVRHVEPIGRQLSSSIIGGTAVLSGVITELVNVDELLRILEERSAA